jgi:hypothetical protein
MPPLSDTTLKDVTVRAYPTNKEKSKCDFRSLEIAIGEGGQKSEVRTVASSLHSISTTIINWKCGICLMFGFTIYLMHLADYLKRKKSKKKIDNNTVKI